VLSNVRVIIVTALALSIAMGGWVVAGHTGQSYTGCLNSGPGAIYNMRPGDTPKAPCKDGDVVIHVSGGDITSVNAGPGLNGGALVDDATLSVNFAGSGSANTVARSDHNHDSTYAAVGHTHDDRYFTETELQTSGSAAVNWGNLTNVPAGFADGVDNESGGAGWSLTGNSGTSPANFLGTTDDRALEIRVNNNRALRLEPTGMNAPGPFPGPSSPRTPNILGGLSANGASAGVEGATVGGGGLVMPDPAIPQNLPNRVTGNFGTVGGGYGNTAAVGATVDGGDRNVASGFGSTVGGGSSNTAGAQHAVVSGGGSNVATDVFASVGGGASNAASGFAATVSGGWTNMASAPFAAVPGGFRASASHYGEVAHANGMFSSAGDAQSSAYVLRGVSAGGLASELFLDGTNQRLTIAPGRTVAFDTLVVGRGGDFAAAYSIRGLVENVSGTTMLVGTPVVTVLGEDDASWSVTVSASDALDAVTVVADSSSNGARWVASVRTAEVGQ
jgi:hypothetical protein